MARWSRPLRGGFDRRSALTRCQAFWRIDVLSYLTSLSHHAGVIPREDLPSDTLLVTGATGFLGMQLVARVLRESDRHIVARVCATRSR